MLLKFKNFDEFSRKELYNDLIRLRKEKDKK